MKDKLQACAAEHPLGSLVRKLLPEVLFAKDGKLELFWIHERGPLVFLLPIGGEGDEPLWRIGRGTRMPLQGAIAGCHCGVLWW